MAKTFECRLLCIFGLHRWTPRVPAAARLDGRFLQCCGRCPRLRWHRVRRRRHRPAPPVATLTLDLRLLP